MEYPLLTSYKPYKPAVVLVKALVVGLIIAIFVNFFFDGVIETDRRYVIAFILGCVATFLVLYQLHLRYQKNETTENNESDLESVVSDKLDLESVVSDDKLENYF